MNLYNWNQVQMEQLNPLFARQVIHGQNMTVAKVHLKGGAVVPPHSHESEQITVLERGRLRFTVGDQQALLRPGRPCISPPMSRTAWRPWRTAWRWICSHRPARTGGAATTPTCAGSPASLTGHGPVLPVQGDGRADHSAVRRATTTVMSSATGEPAYQLSTASCTASMMASAES